MKLNTKSFLTLSNQTIKLMDTEEGELIIEGYANTVAKDRGGDVITASAWQTQNSLENYKKNPVILAFHDHSKPIGTAVEVEPTELGLRLVAKISKAAGALYELVRDNVLRTFSVGFIIHDAEYDSKSDTFFITDVELLEVSVVSVPMNQDSTFQVRKSIEGSFEDIKQLFVKQQSPNDNNTGNSLMNEDLKAAIAEAMKNAAAEQKRIADQEAAEKAKAEADAAARKAEALNAAKAVIEEVTQKLNASDQEFSKTIKKLEDQILAQKDEISQLLASSKKGAFNPSAISSAINGAPSASEIKDIENVYLLGLATKKFGDEMFETSLGKKMKEKAVNTSSSFEVSSEAYETVFTTNLIKDVESRLVIAPLFREITMTAANLTIPVEPGRAYAAWVNASTYGTDATTGPEISGALTEITLKTYKLAGKSYLTDETSEDAIIAMLPLIRERLVTSHVATIERDFLRGNGVAVPVKGLTQIATEDSLVITTAAKADGSVKVTGDLLHKARRRLGLKGLDISNLAILVSLDAYYDLLEDPAFQDMDKVGDAAIKRTGQVGRMYGLPVMVCGEFAPKAVNVPFAVMAYLPDLVVPRQRGATVQTDYDVEKQRRVIVATQRLNLEKLFDNCVVSLTYAAT